ncbi:hypothetical protein [Balneola vulgaris]|jgi:hypothetical protein|uniref:hypothetical protein n=1 Tax=Balneola vulgaris TaxID=287535 RepID=UPI000365CF6F|nr:hypothetical protein [Balneola vulgaris]
MNRKDRNINLFLTLFLLAVGLYMIIAAAWGLITVPSSELFDFENQDIPIFLYITQLGGGFISLFASIGLWLRTKWAFVFGLFSSGVLIAFHLNNLGRAIYQNPTEAIVMAVIIVIILQSLPFLMRHSQRMM